MKSYTKIFCIATILLILSSSAVISQSSNPRPQSVSAPDKIFELSQPDGTIIKAKILGDEFYNWTETVEGYTIEKNRDTGFWEYVTETDSGLLKSSAKVAGKDLPGGIKKHIIDMEKFASAKQRRLEFLAQITSQSALKTAAATGNGRALVILADFNDGSQKPHVTTKAQFESLLFSEETHPTGSMNDYFQEVSYGKYSITGDVVDWTTAPESYSYYSYPDRGRGVYPNNSQNLVEDLINLIDDQVDFSQFDGDGDGYVDGVIIVFEGEFSGESFWPHKWQLSGFDKDYSVYTDGVIIDNYVLVHEQSGGTVSGIGTFCHEWGHILGLPDLYDFYNETYTSQGIGYWGLMGSGNWNTPDFPAHLCAWSKAQLGWITPTVVSENTLNVTIPPVETSPTAYKLWRAGEDNSEYFLIENRQAVGFDVETEGTGLLVWHIDDDRLNDPFVETHKLVDLEEADGLNHLDDMVNYADPGDPYPGSSDVTAFNYTSSPSSRTYAGYDSEVQVNNVAVSGQNIIADLHVIHESAGAAAVSVTDGTANYGMKDTLYISLDYAYAVKGAQFNIGYDAAKLSVSSVFATDRTAHMSLSSNSSGGQSTILLYSTAGDSIAGGTGNILGLEISCTALTSCSIDITFSEAILTDKNNVPVTTSKSSGTFAAAGIPAMEPDDESNFTLPSDSTEISLTFTNSASLDIQFNGGSVANKILTVLQVSDISAEYPDTEPFAEALYYYDISIDTTGFSAELTFGYTDSILSALGIMEDDLAVSYYDSNDTRGYMWHAVPVTIDKDLNTVTVITTHFSLWAVTDKNEPLIVGIDDENPELPDAYKLYQNYPNPFNPSTNIRFSVPAAGSVSIHIYTVSGRQVRTLLSDNRPAGEHNITWDGTNESGVKVSSGVYIYRISAGDFTMSRKMVLIK